jgi:Fe-S cluster assembly iron-binding protein IscA
VVEEGGVQLVCDPVSYEFVRGATVDYTTDIIRSAFEVRGWFAHGMPS